VADAHDGRADGGLDAQFLVQLAGQSLLRALAGLDLTAGKFPQQRHRLVGTALTDQHFAAAHDQRRRHKAQRRAARP